VPSWKNPKHAAQWINTLKRYAFPLIGPRPVSQITSADVLRILSPIWTGKPVTAKRLSQRISAVIRWARASEFYTGDDPVEAALAGLPRQKHEVQHHESLHFDHMPELIRQLRACSAKPESKLALEFLILTAARTIEVLGAKWDEVDFEKRLWVVPASRMKIKETHRVTTGFWQGVPWRVFAKHLVPCQPGPKRVARPASSSFWRLSKVNFMFWPCLGLGVRSLLSTIV
jgi:integrase